MVALYKQARGLIMMNPVCPPVAKVKVPLTLNDCFWLATLKLVGMHDVAPEKGFSSTL